MTAKNRTIPILVVVMVALNGLFLFGSGLFMLFVRFDAAIPHQKI